MPQPFARAHLIAGGFPPGQPAGHDHDYARLRLLELLGARDVHTSSSSDFVDVARWLPNTGLLVTYVSGPFAGEEQAKAIQGWLADGGRWLALHGSSGGKAVKLDGGKRAMVQTSHHEVLGGFSSCHGIERNGWPTCSPDGRTQFASVQPVTWGPYDYQLRGMR